MVDAQTQLCSKTIAFSEGVLIFNEVKVGLSVQWNSRNNEFIGHAMTPQQMLTLHDVYEVLEDDKTSKTSYVLQTLWRDLSSDYDIIGLYYTSEGGLKSKFLVAWHVYVTPCVSFTSSISKLYQLCVMELVQTLRP